MESQTDLWVLQCLQQELSNKLGGSDPIKQQKTLSQNMANTNNQGRPTDPFMIWCLEEAAKDMPQNGLQASGYSEPMVSPSRQIRSTDRVSCEQTTPPDPDEVPYSCLAPRSGSGTPPSGSSTPPMQGMIESYQDVKTQMAHWQLCAACQQYRHISHNFCMHCGAKPVAAVDNGEITAPPGLFRAQTQDTPAYVPAMAVGPQGFFEDFHAAQAPGFFGDFLVAERVSSGSEYENSSAQGQNFAVTAFKGLPTTLMIRNIPMTYTQEALALEWPNNGTYDFFYLPCSANMQRNKTYAFINFTSNRAALDFKEQWDKGRLAQFTTRKALSITCADVQGRDGNLLQLCKKRQWRLKVKECQPLVYDMSGESVTLEEAFAGLEEEATWSL